MVASVDRSSGRLPDPGFGAPSEERRRSVRQKLHTPVYASFNGPQTGLVVDLSELIDLHEGGFAVQTSERLEMNRAVTLCLDLPETRSFIHGTGEVIWSDDTGRGGIRFSPLSESSRKILKEWLFANLLIGCANHAARTEQLARRDKEKSDEALSESSTGDNSTPLTRSATVIPISDRTANPYPLDAVRREIREIEHDLDAVLRLITERALSLTGATGSALALLTDHNMICRARAGEPAPPLGAPVDARHGLSGECVRSGLLVSCEDTENDPRIDPEVGRALGIGSLMAAPLVSDFRVVGLLEVFSPHSHSFTKVHETILDRLAEMVPKALIELPDLATVAPVSAESETSVLTRADVSGTLPSQCVAIEPGLNQLDSLPATPEALFEQNAEDQRRVSQSAIVQEVSKRIAGQVPEPVVETTPGIQSRWVYRALLGLVIAVVAMVVGYLIGPMIERRWSLGPQVKRRSFVNAAEAASEPDANGRGGRPKSLAELRRLAGQGEADAQWQMGVRYHNGEEVPQDDTQAMKWFERAAEQGHVDAQSHLGAYYWAGRGVPEDLSKAYFWSTVAMAQGDEISKARLEGLASQMTRQQVSAARQQAEIWIRTHSQRAKSEAN